MLGAAGSPPPVTQSSLTPLALTSAIQERRGTLMELPPASPASSPRCKRLAPSSLGTQRLPRGHREAVLVPSGLEVGAGAWRGRESACWANPLQAFVPSRGAVPPVQGCHKQRGGCSGDREERGVVVRCSFSSVSWGCMTSGTSGCSCPGICSLPSEPGFSRISPSQQTALGFYLTWDPSRAPHAAVPARPVPAVQLQAVPAAASRGVRAHRVPARGRC